MMPWDVTSERLAAEMQAYTLAEIGRTLAEQAEKPEPKPTSSHAAKHSISKFKPKKPAMRYAERHPEEKAAHDTVMEVDEPYIEDEDMDDGEYIIDTYVRIPAEALETEEHPKNFGLLVLDSQPDIDEFYREEEDTDEEEEDEEEDENGIPCPSFSIQSLTCLILPQLRTTTQPTTRTKKSPRTTNMIGTHTTTAQATPRI
jgi:hypothetical protein